MKVKERQFSELISSLSAILDLDENIKLDHAWRTALIAYQLAKEVVPEDAAQVFFAGLLHDVGAVGLEDHIVHYAEASYLDDEIIFNHPTVGAAIVAGIPGLGKASEYILNHHEAHNGTGYPAKKKGEEIPLESQILYIADHMDVFLRLEQMSKTDIYNTFRVRKGKEFTHELWHPFLDVLNSRGGTYFHMLREKNGYLQLMQEALAEVSERPLELPLDFLDQVLKVFAKIIDAKHSYTHGHTERVVAYSTVLAKARGLAESEIVDVQHGAYLHDIGKLGVPLYILDKKERLTDEEFIKVKRHIIITMEVLDSMSFLRHLTELSGYHHTRWDGRGYPDKVAGEEIQLGARIICIGDSFDAMTSDRAYRKAFDFEQALGELRKNRGTQFDPALIDLLDNPAVVEAFKDIYHSQFA